MIQHATERAESIRVPSNDERRAAWAARYFAQGNHRAPSKPRVRVKPRIRIAPITHALPPERVPVDVDPPI